MTVGQVSVGLGPAAGKEKYNGVLGESFFRTF